MITDCAEKGKVQRARRFYRVAATHKKQFSVHVSSRFKFCVVPIVPPHTHTCTDIVCSVEAAHVTRRAF